MQNQFSIINQKIDQIIYRIEPRKRHKTNKPISDKKYPHEIENLRKDFKQLFDKRIELDSDFSFNEMAAEIRELFRGKRVATPTIKNFYQRKTNPRRKTIEAIQHWIVKEKKIRRVKLKLIKIMMI